MTGQSPFSRMTRREALTGLGVASGATLATHRAMAQMEAGTVARLLPAANICFLTPQAVEGPFYFDQKLDGRTSPRGCPACPSASSCRWSRQATARRCRPPASISGTPTPSDIIRAIRARATSATSRPRTRLPARHAIHRCGWRGCLLDHLSRLVCGPHTAHPFQGLRRREECRDGADLFPGRDERIHLRECSALQSAQPRARHDQRSRRHLAILRALAARLSSRSRKKPIAISPH